VWRYWVVGIGWAGGAGVNWEKGEVGMRGGALEESGSNGVRMVCTDWTTAPAPVPVRFFIAIRINAITLIRIRIHIIIRIHILHSPPIVDVSSVPIRVPVSIIAIIVSRIPAPVRAAAISRPGWRVSGYGYGGSEPVECEQQQRGWLFGHSSWWLAVLTNRVLHENSDLASSPLPVGTPLDILTSIIISCYSC
jgi:predicted secreted protein